MTKSNLKEFEIHDDGFPIFPYEKINEGKPFWQISWTENEDKVCAHTHDRELAQRFSNLLWSKNKVEARIS